MRFIVVLIFSCVFAQELEVEGDLMVTGSVIFQDSSAIHTAPKDLPAGILLPYAGNIPPEGWLLCAGQEVSREAYPNLFTVIGESYGIGDGGATFNLPDLRGRIPMGLDNMAGISADRVANTEADSLGGNAGEEMHQLSFDELPSRNSYISHGTGGQGDSGGSFSYVSNVTTDTVGNDQPHNNMPPYLSLNYIIKY